MQLVPDGTELIFINELKNYARLISASGTEITRDDECAGNIYNYMQCEVWDGRWVFTAGQPDGYIWEKVGS